MDTDGDGTVTKEVRYLIQINSRCPIHILFRLKLIHLKTINLNFKLKSIYQIAEKNDIIFSLMKHFNVCEKGKEAGSEGV